MQSPTTTKGNHMTQIIPQSTTNKVQPAMGQIIKTSSTDVNSDSNLSSYKANPLDDVGFLGENHNKAYHHIWYTLLNKNITSALFKTYEFANYLGCTPRTVYNILSQAQARGELTFQNKGRNGILITMLKKGWELTKSLKTAFLAYFRDKGLIPYINTINTSPSGGRDNKPKDRIEKICAKAGLTESQIRDVKEKVSKMSGIRNFGAVVSYFIQMIKGGIMKASLSGKDIQERHSLKERLEKQAETDAKARLDEMGIKETIPSINASIEELDAFNRYHSIFSTHRMVRLNELCKQHGL